MSKLSGLSSISYDEVCALDFYMKERIRKVINAKEFGTSLDMGKSVFDKYPDVFSLIDGQMKKYSDIRYSWHVFTYDECEDVDCNDWFPLPFTPVCNMFTGISIEGKHGAGSVEEVVNDACGYWYREVPEQERRLMCSMLKSYRLYERGKKRLALKKGMFRELCSFLANYLCPFNGELSLYFIADNISQFLSYFSDCGEEDELYHFVYSSSEVTHFDEYKERLPSDIRKKAEEYLDVFFHPFSFLSGSVDVQRYGDNTVVVCNMVISKPYNLPYDNDAESYDYDESDDVPSWYEDGQIELSHEMRYVNPYFDTALRWLGGNLKKLRLTYGNVGAAA